MEWPNWNCENDTFLSQKIAAVNWPRDWRIFEGLACRYICLLAQAYCPTVYINVPSSFVSATDVWPPGADKAEATNQAIVKHLEHGFWKELVCHKLSHVLKWYISVVSTVVFCLLQLYSRNWSVHTQFGTWLAAIAIVLKRIRFSSHATNYYDFPVTLQTAITGRVTMDLVIALLSDSARAARQHLLLGKQSTIAWLRSIGTSNLDAVCNSRRVLYAAAAMLRYIHDVNSRSYIILVLVVQGLGTA